MDILRCPVSGASMSLEDAILQDGEIVSGQLVSSGGKNRYPIINSIPRFVKAANYADNFGLQWTLFRQTQLDSSSGLPISANRFYEFTKWSAGELAGKRVLDVGCGAGRFTEIALEAGAEVVAVDYSQAVDACWANHGSNTRLSVVQADIYNLPFDRGRFDFVYCFGVLQHTPDVRAAFFALPEQLTRDGRLAVDLYPSLLRNLFWSKYWIRPLTKRIRPDRLFAILKRWAPRLLAVSKLVGKLPLLGGELRYLLPVVNYDGVYPLSPEQLEEWAILDTFDMLSPAFDQPQRESTLRRWFVEARLRDVSVERIGFLVGRGTR